MDEIILKEENGEILANSREVAKHFEKEARNVVRDIRNLTAQNCAVEKMFIETTYINERGREYPMYLMNRDGFSLLVMGFTGKKALEWKLKYIDAFNKMEEMLKNKVQVRLPATYEEAMELWLETKKESEQLIERNKELEPKALIVDNMLKNDSAVTTTITERIKNTDVAKKWNRKIKSGEIKGTTINVLEYIHDFINNKGYCPSVREICKGIGISSTSTVQAHMVKLNNLGYLIKNHKETRNMRINEEKYVSVMSNING